MGPKGPAQSTGPVLLYIMPFLLYTICGILEKLDCSQCKGLLLLR